MTGVRAPAVAGQFYDSDGQALAHQVEGCFLDPRGPGELPPRHRAADRHVRAIVVPHAGFEFSGPIAALAYARLARERPPSHVLLLGVDHHGAVDRAAASDEDWMTPLGRVPIDSTLLGRVAHRPIVVNDPA